MPITAYAKTLLEDNLPQQMNGTPFATPEEWTQAFLSWAEGHERTTPLLSEEAISRESIYEDRD